MKLFMPDLDQMLGLQKTEQRYYFSAAAELLLHKYGWLRLPDDVQAERVSGLVTRQTPWREEFRNYALVFEGPLHASTAAQLHTDVKAHTTDSLELLDGRDVRLATLVRNRVNVRRIPETYGTVSEPFQFVSTDPYWNSDDFEYQTFESLGGALLRTHAGDVVAKRAGQHIILGIPALDLCVQHHALSPLDVGYYSMRAGSNLSKLESWIFERVREQALTCSTLAVQLGVWPYPYDSALTVRHDFDRAYNRLSFFAAKDQPLRDLLAFYANQGVKSTFFWRTATAERAQLRRVLRSGHEVALHTEAHCQTSFNQELACLAHEYNIQVHGYSAHGGTATAGYLGQTQVVWAENAQLMYGEMLGTGMHLPTFAVRTAPERLPSLSRLVLPAQHTGLDTGTSPEKHRYAEALADCRQTLKAGGQAVLMNHPDIHLAELKALLLELDLQATWKATLREVAQWTANKLPGRWETRAEGLVLHFVAPLSHPVTCETHTNRGRKKRVLPSGTRTLLFDSLV